MARSSGGLVCGQDSKFSRSSRPSNRSSTTSGLRYEVFTDQVLPSARDQNELAFDLAMENYAHLTSPDQLEAPLLSVFSHSAVATEISKEGATPLLAPSTHG